MVNVAIVIINWNGKVDTLSCLASLYVLVPSVDPRKIYIVDNGSQDNSVLAIKEKFPKVTIIENHQNLGFTGGNNIGITQALEEGAKRVWLLNNDTTVERKSLTALLRAFDDSSVGIAGSKIYFFPGREYHLDHYKKTERGKVLWYAGGYIDWGNMYASHRGVNEIDVGQYDEQEETPFVTGCSMMIRSEVFKEIGLFDQRYFAYLEDLDFSLRARTVKYKLLYVPTSVVWHKNAGSSAVGSELHQYYMTRNRFLVGIRYASVRTKLALVRESLRFVFQGPPVAKEAVLDAFWGRFGKRL